MNIKKVFIAGAGFMGAGIAQVVLQAGFECTLYDIYEEQLQKSQKDIINRLEKSASKGVITKEQKNHAVNNLRISTDVGGCKDSDFLIEAIIENEDAKKKVLAELSNSSKETAIISSNTSSISITSLSCAVKNPERFLGTHFFSPVPSMKLIELIKGMVTSDETIKSTMEFGKKLDKVCIVSKDNPGFIVDRLLDPMINEAIYLLDEGVGSIEDIDKGMKYGLNHPMGPLELIDMAGIDIELAVMEVLYSETGDPKYRPSPLLKKMVRLGYTGKKAGVGFYIYGSDGTKSPNPYLYK